MVGSFSKSNGMLESKCFVIRRFIKKMSFEQANLLLRTIEDKVSDNSRGNIFVVTLNIVKAATMLIEVIEKVKRQFPFLDRRVLEIRSKIVRIATKFMSEVTSEEEMRFYLLEKDLDGRDPLTIIYDYDV